MLEGERIEAGVQRGKHWRGKVGRGGSCEPGSGQDERAEGIVQLHDIPGRVLIVIVNWIDLIDWEIIGTEK